MSVSSSATFRFSSPEQSEAVKRYEFSLPWGEQKSIEDFGPYGYKLTGSLLEFHDCFGSVEDYESAIPELAQFVAEEVPDKNFTVEEAGFLNEVDGSGVNYDISYIDGELKIGVKYHGFDEEDFEDPWDLTFVVTGKLNYFENRDSLVEYLEDAGANVSGSVSKKTDYLICNDQNATSSKMKKAKELGVPVITEEEFIVKFCDLTDFDDLYDKYSEGFWTYTVTKIR